MEFVMFKVHVENSNFGENFQVVMGRVIDETSSYITVDNLRRAVSMGNTEAVRRFTKSRIASPIHRMEDAVMGSSTMEILGRASL